MEKSAREARLATEDHEAEDLFQTFVEACPDSVMVVQDGHYVYANPAALENLGYDSIEELKHVPVLDTILPEYHDTIKKRIKRIQAGLPNPSMRLSLIRHDGTIIITQSSSVEIQFRGKKAALIIGHDITGQEQALEKLRQSERQKDLILENTAEMFAHYSLDLKILWANKAAADSVNRTVSDIIGEYCYKVWHDSDEPCEYCPVLRARNSGEPHETERQTPDGRYFMLRGYPIKDDQGNIVSLTEFGYDISHRRMAEEKLQASERNLTSIINASHQSAFLIEADGHIIACNNIAASRLGAKVKDMIGESIYSFLTPPLVKSRKKQVDQVVRTGKPVTFEDIRSGLHLLHNLYPIKDHDGNVRQIAIFAHDITEFRENEEKLKRRNHLLASIRKAQSLFISGGSLRQAHKEILDILVESTNSEYGFFDEVLRRADGSYYKRSLAISDISWDDESKRLYQQLVDENLEFNNLDHLAGAPVISGKTIIANDAPKHKHARGLPKGHPAIKSFMGIPLFYGCEIVGVAGVANRDGGYSKEVETFISPLIHACAAFIWAERIKKREQENVIALKESEAKYRRLVETSNEGIMSLDALGNIEYVNRRMAKMLGYGQDEMINKHVESFIYPEDIDGYRDQVVGRRKGKAAVYEQRFITKDSKEIIWTIVSATPITDIRGGVIGAFAMITDISDRKRAEEALQKAVRLLGEEKQLLEDKNIALRELMEQVRGQREDLTQQLQSTVERVILPTLDKIEGYSNPQAAEYIAMLKENLEEMTQPFYSRLSVLYAALTPREVEMCNMVRRGMSSKDIALAMNVSVNTVFNHRRNIRRKLNIADSDANLATFLRSIGDS